MIAADLGLSGGTDFDLLIALGGIAVAVAMAALTHAGERPFSASMFFVGLGVLGSIVLGLFEIARVEPVRDHVVLERVAELALIIALFTTGLRVRARLAWPEWRGVLSLLGIGMVATVAVVSALGATVMGLSLGAAIMLGAALAPTDPVLAGSLGLGAPGERRPGQHARHTITNEAGLNDGLVFPFFLLGVFVAEREGSGWLLEWVAWDLAYGLALALAIGVGAGYAIAAAVRPLRARGLLGGRLDGLLALAAAAVSYGIAELVGAYGFVAVFTAGAAFARHELAHEYNRELHDESEELSKLAELVVLVFLGTLVTGGALGEPGVGGWAVALALILVVRPAIGWLALAGSGISRGERSFLAWFGVRGVATLNYAALAAGVAALSQDERSTVLWTAAIAVILSVFIHGSTATPLARRLLR